MHGTPTNWTCRKCGGVGTVPVHRADCQAHDAGRLAISQPVSTARDHARYFNETYTAEARYLAGKVRADLQDAIEQVIALLCAIDNAAIGAL